MAPLEGDPEGPVKEIPLKRSDGLLLIMDTPKGRGVFAGKDIPAQTVLEISPVLVLDPVENEEHIRKTNLYNYTYNWPYDTPGAQTQGLSGPCKPPKTTQAVILGLGSMFNHSSMRQNVGWKRDLTHLLITYTALRDIKKGEELCISYGSRLTFQDIEAEELASGSEDENEVLSRIDILD